MGRFSHTEWKESASSRYASVDADSLFLPLEVPSPAAPAPAKTSATHESVIRTGLADYPFIARKALTMWGTAELDRFLIAVMLESSESARKGFETLDLVAVDAIVELIKMNRSAMDRRSANPAPPTRSAAWERLLDKMKA